MEPQIKSPNKEYNDTFIGVRYKSKAQYKIDTPRVQEPHVSLTACYNGIVNHSFLINFQLSVLTESLMEVDSSQQGKSSYAT